MKPNLGNKLLIGIHKIKENKGGFIGCLLLLFLITMCLYAVFFVDAKARSQWNDPLFWTDNPKSAAPVWLNYVLKLFNYQIPEHVILDKKEAIVDSESDIDFNLQNVTFNYNFDFNEFPSSFSIPYTLEIGEIPPVIDVYVKRPDGQELMLYSISLDSVTIGQNDSFDNRLISGKIFSSSQEVRNSLDDYSNLFSFSTSGLPSEKIVFSETKMNTPLKGDYKIIFSLYSFDNETTIGELKLVIDGRVFGLLGTDEFKRDVFFGILIGTPVALFIGVSVALSSSVIGLFYGLMAGYKGKKTGILMLILIDIFMTIPSFILLIIISLNFGRNLLFLIALFILFGWPGLALLNRTFSIQLKNYQYVEASKLMGESDFKIVFRHMIPQLLAFTLANFALSVPSAILGESALSFLGFGDPSFPTWGQMLEDAHSSSAEIKGYWWWVLAPGVMISITSIAFILIGRSLEGLVKISKKR